MTTMTIRLIEALDARYIHTFNKGGYEEVLYRAEFDSDDGTTEIVNVVNCQSVTFESADSDELISRGEKWTLVPADFTNALFVKDLADYDKIATQFVQAEVHPDIDFIFEFA